MSSSHTDDALSSDPTSLKLKNGEKKRKLRDVDKAEDDHNNSEFQDIDSTMDSTNDSKGFEQAVTEDPIESTSTTTAGGSKVRHSRERGLLQSPSEDPYVFSEDDSISSGGLFPRKYFKRLHRKEEVFAKGDVVSMDVKEGGGNGGDLQGSESFAQILCFFLNHKRFMQMQIKWLRPVAYSMNVRTRRGNPMPVSFASGSMEKHPQPVELVCERIPWDKRDQAADSNWEKERKDTFKKKRKDKHRDKEADDKNNPSTVGEFYSFVGENVFLNPFDIDIDVEKQSDLESAKLPKDEIDFTTPQPHEAATTTPQESLPFWNAQEYSNPYRRKAESPTTVTTQPNDYLKHFGHRSNPSVPEKNPARTPERIPLDSQTLLALGLNATVRQEMLEVINHLDKRGDLYASPLQFFLEGLTLYFDSLDRVQLALKRLPSQGQLHFTNGLTPSRMELDAVPYKTFCAWISALRNTIRT